MYMCAQNECGQVEARGQLCVVALILCGSVQLNSVVGVPTHRTISQATILFVFV